MKKVSAETVMIIDDNEIDIFINRKVLEFGNFCERIVTTQSAEEALEILKSEEEIPGLILLDLNMPVMDGFRFLYEFSTLEKEVKDQVRVVVLTSSDNARDKEKAAANPYVSTFVSKPLNEQKLQKLIDFLGVKPAIE